MFFVFKETGTPPLPRGLFLFKGRRTQSTSGNLTRDCNALCTAPALEVGRWMSYLGLHSWPNLSKTAFRRDTVYILRRLINTSGVRTERHKCPACCLAVLLHVCSADQRHPPHPGAIPRIRTSEVRPKYLGFPKLSQWFLCTQKSRVFSQLCGPGVSGICWDLQRPLCSQG